MVINGASLALLLLSGVHMLWAQSNSNTVTWSSFTLAGLSCSLIDCRMCLITFCQSTLLLSAGVLSLWGILLLVLVQEPLEVLRNWRSGLVVLDKPWFPHSSGLQRQNNSGKLGSVRINAETLAPAVCLYVSMLGLKEINSSKISEINSLLLINH